MLIKQIHKYKNIQIHKYNYSWWCGQCWAMMLVKQAWINVLTKTSQYTNTIRKYRNMKSHKYKYIWWCGQCWAMMVVVEQAWTNVLIKTCKYTNTQIQFTNTNTFGGVGSVGQWWRWNRLGLMCSFKTS